ncbi:CoA:oxalate CoA-transferase [Burkholderia sp. D7]|nr:CoA:oxalate CoA-transferase [Burkholderia sp. D7]
MLSNSTGALTGLRILDLSHAMAGPFCSQVLADHGADVIKVEPPEGDFFRRVGPFTEDDSTHDYGGFFQSCNRNKRSIVLDLKQPAGRELFLQLVGESDALVENYRAGVLEKLELGYSVLAERNPRLVYTSIRGFGDVTGGESPYMKWPAFDIVAQAMGGWMGITGMDTDHPTKVGGGLADTVSGLFAAFGTMAALWKVRSTGEGQYVDVAMVDSVLALSELVTSLYSYTGQVPTPAGNGIPGLAPFATVKAKDGVIALAAPHDPQWAELCRIMDKPELIDDVRFSSEPSRWINRAELYAHIESFTGVRSKEELKQLLGGRIPFSPIYNAAEIFADPHFAIRQMLPEVEQPGSSRKVHVPGVPVKLSKTPGGVRHRAPLLGEHTAAVLKEYGISADRIAALQLAAVVGGK